MLGVFTVCFDCEAKVCEEEEEYEDYFDEWWQEKIDSKSKFSERR